MKLQMNNADQFSRRNYWPAEVHGGAAATEFVSDEGAKVGLLHLNTQHALLPGNVQNGRTFKGPVLRHEIACSDISALLQGDPRLEPLIGEACQDLERRGAVAIAGACGSFGFFQAVGRDAVSIPVFLSIMTQVPFLLSGLAKGAKLGVICAASSSLNQRLFDACGIGTPTRLVIAQMIGKAEFDRMLRAEQPMYPYAMQRECVEVAEEMILSEPDVAAILLQCSDLPPFAHAIQEATGRPVFDMAILVNWLLAAASYSPYSKAD